MVKEKAANEEQSEFNSAIATLKRLDFIKKNLIVATARNDVDYQWVWLKAFYKELVSIMDDNDDLKQRERFKEVRKFYNIYINAKRSGKKTIPVYIVDAIEDWEIELKNIEQAYGLGILKRQSVSDVIGES